jgi:hypothetical protein
MRAGAAAMMLGLLAWLAPAIASARASPRDVAATTAYLRLEYASTRRQIDELPAGLVAIDELGKHLEAQCPGELAAAPKPARGTAPTISAAEFADEELIGIVGVAEHLEYMRARKLARAVAALHWSDPVLTRTAHSKAAAEAARDEIPTPDLCADGQAWATSGYQAVSAATMHYLQAEARLTKKTEDVEATIKHRLLRYESQDDRRIAKRIAHLEKSAIPPLVNRLLAALGQVHEVLHGPSAAPAA